MTGVLLTRSREENAVTAQEITALGYTPYCVDMLYFIDHENITIPDTYSHIIITSKHAARLVKQVVDSKKECWVVGEESAKLLQTNQFIEITGIAKNVEELLGVMQLVPQNERAEFFQKSIYISGNIITQELPQYITRYVVYDTVYTDFLNPEAVQAIQNGMIHYYMVYSKNCAMNLINLLKKHNMLPYIDSSVVIAIGEKVASLFEGMAQNVAFSKMNSAREMIELLVTYEQTKRNEIKETE